MDNSLHFCCLALILVFAACGSPSEPEEQGAPSSSPGATGGAPEALGAPRFVAQPGWTEQKPESAMRYLEFVLEGEGSPVLVVSHWPNGVGGLDANMDRWRGSVTGSDPGVGKTTFPNDLRIDSLRKVGQVTDGMGGPASEGALMVAYVESPAGRFPGVYTVKVMGPTATLDAHAERFEAFLAGL